MSNLAPVPSESPACANCRRPARRRPALLPVVRAAVLTGAPRLPRRARERAPAALGPRCGGRRPVALSPYFEPVAGPAWLRRYAPLFGCALRAGARADRRPARRSLGHPGQEPPVRRSSRSRASWARRRRPAAPRRPRTTAPATAAEGQGDLLREVRRRTGKGRSQGGRTRRRNHAAAPPVKNDTNAVNKLEKTTGSQHEKELNELSTPRSK